MIEIIIIVDQIFKLKKFYFLKPLVNSLYLCYDDVIKET